MVIEWMKQTYRKRKAIARKLRNLKSRKTKSGPPEFEKLELTGYANGSRWVVDLEGPLPFLSEAPRLFGTPAQHIVGTFPAIAVREFRGAVTHPEASAIVSENKVLVPPFYEARSDALIQDGSLLISQSPGFGMVLRAETKKVNEGVCVFGSGSLNWYHWLIEILPAAFLAERLPADLRSLPLIVPKPCLEHPSFHDSLMLFSRDREIVPIPVGSLTHIERLIFIDPPVVGPMNLSSGRWPVIADYSQNDDVLRQYRSAMLERLGIAPAKPHRRIFLARANERRSFNQSDLIEIAAGHGFEVVQPETMSFRDQAALFSEADILLGASGAAFANIIFCQPGTRSLTWVLPHYGEFCAYSNLARLLDIKLRYMFVDPEVEITNSFEAYLSSYSVDSAAFERNLNALLADAP